MLSIESMGKSRAKRRQWTTSMPSGIFCNFTQQCVVACHWKFTYCTPIWVSWQTKLEAILDEYGERFHYSNGNMEKRYLSFWKYSLQVTTAGHFTMIPQGIANPYAALTLLVLSQYWGIYFLQNDRNDCFLNALIYILKLIYPKKINDLIYTNM